MITIINEFENKMWQAAQKGDKSGFLQLVEADAVQEQTTLSLYRISV